MRAIIHVDMDAFYASVEQRDNPELRGKPLIVGGDARRGVVVAASYEVRKYGVRSAMPMARAMKLAPHAVVVKPRFSAYSDASEQVFSIFERYTPLVEPLSLDEAFLDVTASVGLFGAPADMARRIRKEIAAETGLPASAGIAAVKFVAKIASDVAKPNGQREVRAEETVAFLAGLPVGRLWGVGPKTEEALKRSGLETIGDVARRDVAWMEARWGSSGRHLWELAQGIDPREVVPDREAKSVGAEDTFDEDLTGMEALSPHVHSQALRVGRRLRRAGVKGRVVQLKVKFADFTLITRRTTLPLATDDGQTLYRVAKELLEKAHEDKPVRLTGVSMQELGMGSGEERQLGLFTEPEKPKKSDKLNAVLDRIAERFGTKAVTTADIAGTSEADPDPERPKKPKRPN
ncbi:DNA polymerase IV [Vitiosangium sp. GDMCC 1.1324]|uniref:DNA polymerase IV n=1 Tax=Vitiosangium sp. (strain GDMCC 1.1324) TaxID=2138576 RepID=UPI000D34B897|nr:DNA polymerase IV [Vitiosangium sp. GDMCC 1.1324]PTL80384.1 DNA polymerase IV [Vitiosangium sp. GDMCC 1.1324]